MILTGTGNDPRLGARLRTRAARAARRAMGSRRDVSARGARRTGPDGPVRRRRAPRNGAARGWNYLALALAMEEIAAGDGATSTIIAVNNLVTGILNGYATPAQKEQFLKPLASGAQLGCFCLTEPHVGSDASAIRTSARREGNDWVLNGVKQFITIGQERATSPSCSRSAARAAARRASAPSSCRPRRQATSSRTSRKRWASTPRTRRRSRSRTAACRPPTCSAPRARATASRCPTWRAGASASPRRRWAWRARPTRRR